MKLSCVLAALASTTLARTTRVTSTYEHCITGVGPTRAKSLQTKTETVYTAHAPVYTVTVETTPTSTITPAQPTSTTTTTSTIVSVVTASQITDVDTTTTTSTIVETETSTNSITSTMNGGTVTVTTTSTGITVSTVAGFTPVASVGSVVANGGGTDTKRKRSVRRPRAKSVVTAAKHSKVAAKHLLSSTRQQTCPARHPVSVTCFEELVVYTIATSIKTAPATTITAATPAAATTTGTTLTTTTSTAPIPDATSTSTITTVVTTTSTSTTSTTLFTTIISTATSVVPADPTYAACASNNIINEVGSVALDNASSGDFYSVTSATSDPVPCCNSCQSSTECAGWILNDFNGYTCVLVGNTDGTCDPTTSTWEFLGNTGNNQVSVGNGPCGQGSFSA